VPAANQSPKVHAAVAAAGLIRHGMVVGLGSGSTAALMVRRLGERIEQEGLRITAVATSVETARLASALGIAVCELDTVAALDINLDGADEIDPRFRMIKGRGGALLREKIVACASDHRVTMITPDKRVDRLGSTVPVPVEVSSIGLTHTERRLRLLGCSTTIRRHPDGSFYTTDGGNQIVDCRFESIDDPEALDRELQCMAGVLDTGFFIGLCDTLIVGNDNGAEQIDAGVRPRPAGLSRAAGP
jgi:ribose 5-phosphate isomerase A